MTVEHISALPHPDYAKVGEREFANMLLALPIIDV